MKWQKQENSISIETPAKLNLFLEVTGKRADGFHDLKTVITEIDRVDQMQILPAASGNLSVDCRWSESLVNSEQYGSTLFGDLPQGEKNLVYQAAQMFLARCDLKSGLEIRLTKSIPSQAGLGGASGNAAGTLLGLNELFQTGLETETLNTWAAELGSDVPFFIHGGYAVCEGRGEKVTPLEFDLNQSFVVFKPEFGLSTPRIFSELRLSGSTKSLEISELADPHWDWSKRLFNRLQEPAELCAPEIQRICNRLLELGCSGSMMTGSGSCCFGICKTHDQARQIATEIEQFHSGIAFTCRNLTNFSVRE